MIILEECHEIAVALNKGLNMRVSAGVKYAKVVEYVFKPGTDGAQQVIAAGQDPTHAGIWRLIVADPSYPRELGTSFSSGRRQLSIGKAPDPTYDDKKKRTDQSEYRARSSYNSDLPESTNVTDIGEWVAMKKEPATPLPIPERPHIKFQLAAWFDDTEEERAFLLSIYTKPLPTYA